MPSTARVTVLMKPDEKRALMVRASHEKVSVGELVRGELFAERRGEDRTLAAAIDTLRVSSEATKSTLDDILRTLAKRDKTAQARAAAIRSELQKEMQSWSPEQTSRIRELFLGSSEARS